MVATMGLTYRSDERYVHRVAAFPGREDTPMRSIYRGGLSRFFAPPPVERREPDIATRAWLERCKKRQAAREAQRAKAEASRPARDDSAMQTALQQIENIRLSPRSDRP